MTIESYMGAFMGFCTLVVLMLLCYKGMTITIGPREPSNPPKRFEYLIVDVLWVVIIVLSLYAGYKGSMV